MLSETSKTITVENKLMNPTVSELSIHLKIHITLIYPCHLNDSLKESLVLQANNINTEVLKGRSV